MRLRNLQKSSMEGKKEEGNPVRLNFEPKTDVERRDP